MKEPCVTTGFLAPSKCEALIDVCEEASFSVDPNPEYAQATTDLEVDKCPEVRKHILDLGLVEKLVEAIYHYTSGLQQVKAFNDVFVVKYDADKQRDLIKHTDAGDVSFMLALSPRTSYRGGGTAFESIKGPLHLDQGSCVVFDAKLKHQGLPITQGKRLLLVAFCYTQASSTRVAGNLSLSIRPLQGNRNR